MKIDWRAYYDEFSRMHGGDPVLYGHNKETGLGGWLLFPDGWRYGRVDPSGPEVPPGSDQKRLIRAYWLIRKRTVKEEVRVLKSNIIALATVQRERSAPITIQERMLIEDEEGRRKTQLKTVPVDFGLLLNKYRDLSAELRRCQNQLDSPTIVESSSDQVNLAGILTELEEIDNGGELW